ncbi:purple acid phosphatase family protein [Aquisphaera insulae]|uniref:purple acid phosphatase family protein n=1 Tax=Aquisphaera insulae TaxID=2712864 RepID=UPI0013EB16EB|nr:metallophosphoesterase family protein [Aquisphaera insulae]
MTTRSALTRWAAGSLALFLTVAVACAHDGHDDDHRHDHDHDHEHDHDHPPIPVPEPEAHRPSAIPDRIIRTFAGDTARTIAVTWRTDSSVAKAIAQIAPADAAPNFGASAKTITAVSQPLTTDLGPARFHSVVFSGLGPAQLYAYRVGDGANWSEWVHARTALDGPEPFSFIYFGDAQNDIKSLWSRVIRGAYSDAPKAAFIVHAGDLVNRGSRDAEWGEWFQGGGWVNAMVPSLPTPGNHEYERVKAPAPAAAAADVNAPAVKPDEHSAITRHWRAQFALPEHGPPGLEETVYYVDYQGARIVSLNSNERQAEQVPWLEKVLADNPNRWTILTFHHPIYSAAGDRDNPKLRDLWQPVFDRHKVDLVLQGHDHTYARSGLRAYNNVPTGLSRRDDGGGTVYVVSVSGPKMYDSKREPWMIRMAEDTQLYQIITVRGDALIYEARTAVGDLYDGFELRKKSGAPNELIERAPTTPERRRPAKPAAAAAAR